MSTAIEMNNHELEDSSNNWSKKSAAVNLQDARISKLVRHIQSLFVEKDILSTDQRVSSLNEIKTYLNNVSSNSLSVGAPVITNFLKNWIKHFHKVDRNPNLRGKRGELEILVLIIQNFPSFIPSHRNNLLKIFLCELSFLSDLKLANYRSFLIELFAQTAVAGKWSSQASDTFKLHYQCTIEMLINSIYFLAYKYEFYNKSEEFAESLSANGEPKFIETKQQLLKLSECCPKSFVLVLMRILKRLISIEIVHVANFPVKSFVNLCVKILQDVKSNVFEAEKLSEFLLSLKIECMDLIKLVCCRFGSVCVVFIHPIMSCLMCYLKKSAGVLSRMDENCLAENSAKCYSKVFELAECVITNMTKYGFDCDELGKVLVSITSSLHRFATHEKQTSSALEDPVKESATQSSAKKTSRKRKRDRHVKSEQTGKDCPESKINTTNKTLEIKFIISVCEFSACLFKNCSHLFSSEVIHKSMLNIVSLSITIFSSFGNEFTVSTAEYPNVKLFKKEDVSLAMLTVIEGLICRPNPKCSPPVAILAEVVKLAANNERKTLSCKAKNIQVLIEIVTKPNLTQVFSSIEMQYEPKTEFENQLVQTENQVKLVSVYVQTNQLAENATGEFKAEKYNPPVKRKSRNCFVQTDEKMFAKLKKVGNKSDVVKRKTGASVKLQGEDENNFVEICEQFVPDII